MYSVPISLKKYALSFKTISILRKMTTQNLFFYPKLNLWRLYDVINKCVTSVWHLCVSWLSIILCGIINKCVTFVVFLWLLYDLIIDNFVWRHLLTISGSTAVVYEPVFRRNVRRTSKTWCSDQRRRKQRICGKFIIPLVRFHDPQADPIKLVFFTNKFFFRFLMLS